MGTHPPQIPERPAAASKLLVFKCESPRVCRQLGPRPCSKALQQRRGYLGKSSPRPAGGLLTDVEGVQVGQARGGLLQQSDGLQAEVGEILLLHVLQEAQRRGHRRGPWGSAPQHTSLILFLKVIQFYLETLCLRAFALINIWYWVSLFSLIIF